MATKATREQVEQLIAVVIAKHVPAVGPTLKVEFDRRYSFQFEAKRSPGGIKLVVSVSPKDRDLFMDVLRRAATAVAQLHFKTTTTRRVIGRRPVGKALVRLDCAPSVYAVRCAEDAEWMAMWARGANGKA